MSDKKYSINKGINRAIEFRGLKAQYIVYLAVGLVGLFVAFAIIYIAGIPPTICVGLAFSGGGILFHLVYKLNKRYGQYGMLKKRTARRTPKVLTSRTRSVFMIQEKPYDQCDEK